MARRGCTTAMQAVCCRFACVTPRPRDGRRPAPRRFSEDLRGVRPLHLPGTGSLRLDRADHGQRGAGWIRSRSKLGKRDARRGKGRGGGGGARRVGRWPRSARGADAVHRASCPRVTGRCSTSTASRVFPPRHRPDAGESTKSSSSQLFRARTMLARRIRAIWIRIEIERMQLGISKRWIISAAGLT